jgi:hypothetical protein
MKSSSRATRARSKRPAMKPRAKAATGRKGRRPPKEPPPKASTQCGSCRTLFRCECIDLTGPPTRCPICFGSGTYWTDPDGMPIGVLPEEPRGFTAPSKQVHKSVYDLPPERDCVDGDTFFVRGQ